MKKEITRQQLIKKYIEFFKSKAHKQIPNASLIPENDSTVLFTTAGMHPLVPYLLGQKHPLGKRLVNVQKCIRTQDIDEVGDSCHHTFFEMLGNWSLGDYWKKEAIKYTFEFFTKILKMPINKLAVSCFKGDKTAIRDSESAKIWELLGIQKSKIIFLDKKENWWEISGKGPCGPDTEIFYYNKKKIPKKFNPEDKNWIEIGNNVLMQYEKDKKGNYHNAKQKNIDFGGGLERIITLLLEIEDNYLSPVFLPIIKQIEILSGKKYSDEKNKKPMRIIADHIKASVMILNDKIIPSNLEQGYVLRKLIRRAIRYSKQLKIKSIAPITFPVFKIYSDYKFDKKIIKREIEKEEIKFLKTLEKGIKIFNKISKNKKQISGKDAFLLYQSYGFPFEITKELANEKNIKIDEKIFEEKLKKHQKLSRIANKKKFKSGLADNSEATTKLHTAVHLLNKALKVVLKSNIFQKGSNITSERLRFDFNFDRKLTERELKDIEKLVNKKIQEKIPVKCIEMPIKNARKLGAEGIFDSKYKDKVKVYFIGDFSKEICSGPHVKNTGELGRFKIIKEQSSSAGVRRIRAILE